VISSLKKFPNKAGLASSDFGGSFCLKLARRLSVGSICEIKFSATIGWTSGVCSPACKELCFGVLPVCLAAYSGVIAGLFKSVSCSLKFVLLLQAMSRRSNTENDAIELTKLWVEVCKSWILTWCVSMVVGRSKGDHVGEGSPWDGKYAYWRGQLPSNPPQVSSSKNFRLSAVIKMTRWPMGRAMREETVMHRAVAPCPAS
jgi:hypothetical protein